MKDLEECDKSPPPALKNFWLAFKLHRVRRCLSHPTLLHCAVLESPHAALHFYILQSFSFLSHTVDFPNLSQTDSLPPPTRPLVKIQTIVVSYKSHLGTQPFALIFTHPRRVLSEVVVDAALFSRLGVVLSPDLPARGVRYRCRSVARR